MSLWDNKDAEPWDQNVPPDLISAIKHLHDTFQLAHSEFGLLVTMPLCYSRLHRGAHKSGFEDIDEYKKALIQLQLRAGPGPTQRFHDLVSQGTLPAIFKAFFNFYLDGTCLRARFVFKQLLEIARANETRLSCGQVEWAEAQTKYLIRFHRHSIGLWVQFVCDEHLHDLQEDSEERVFWRKWQAPAFLIMKPSHSGPYDAVRVWERQDSETSSRWLESFADQYVIRLEAAIRGEAGQARVEEAKRPNPTTDTRIGKLQQHTQPFTWKELETRFRDLHAKTKERVSTDFIRTEWSSGSVIEKWNLGGNAVWQAEFEALASIAAQKLGRSQVEGGTEHWLDRVRGWMQQRGLDRDKNLAHQVIGTVTEGIDGTTQGMSTDKIAELSKMFCMELIAHGTPESAVSSPPTGNLDRASTTSERSADFTASDDYRTIAFKGKKYALTKLAADIVRELHQASLDSKTGVSADRLRRATRCAKVWDAFKRQDGKAFYKDAIRKPSKDVFTLNIE